MRCFTNLFSDPIPISEEHLSALRSLEMRKLCHEKQLLLEASVTKAEIKEVFFKMKRGMPLA